MADRPPRIEDVIEAASKQGHAQCKAVLGVASSWLVARARTSGLDIAGFRHVIDTSAVRHIKNRHGNEKIEHGRGQLVISDADIVKIPMILKAPDQLLFGARTPRRQPVIGYIKRLQDGTVLFLEQVRAGRKNLSALSMRKYPAATLSSSIAATLESNGRTDGGTTINIVDVPENVTAIDVNVPESVVADGPEPTAKPGGAPPKQGLRQFIKFLPPVIGVVVLAAMVLVLHRMLARIRPSDILQALEATPLHAVVDALGLLAVSLIIMMFYDVPGILFAKKLMSFPPIGRRHVALASFCAYALSHVLGAPALTGAAIRLRLYAQWGVPAAGIARIIALSATNFVLGGGLLASLILLQRPEAVPLFGHDVSLVALNLAGLVLLAVILAYVVAAGRRGAPLTLFGRAVPLPGSALAAAQLVLSCVDIAVAGGILFAVLPSAPGLSVAEVLTIYLAAFAGGLFSGLPGGVGVFDSLLLLGLASYLPPAAAIGAILLFRVIYYLIPASAAALCFCAHEIFLTTKG